MSIETMTKIGSYTVTAAGGDNSITFSNIPQHYSDIVLKASLRSTAGSNLSNPALTINSDTASSYFRKEMYAEGTASTGGEYTSDRLVGGIPAGNASASVFGNLEVYFSNYASNSWKNYNFDSNAPTTTTSAYSIWSGSTLYYNTAPITSINLLVNVGGSNYAQHSTFTLYGVKNTTKASINAPKAYVTGGTLSSDSQYFYRTFTSSGTLSVTGAELTAEILVVAGGGAGGASNSSGFYGGGGGAGGLLGFTNTDIYGAHTVVIGGGGAYPGPNRRGIAGTNSSFGSIIANGGGGGGGGSDSSTFIASEKDGGVGGSGGGGQSAANGGNGGGVGGAGISGQGNAGGNGAGVFQVEPQAGGGGGGAGGVGANATSAATGGAGGVGSSAYSAWGLATGTGQLSSGIYYYAGGGGGASNGTGGAAGLGGGGAGGGSNGANGTANTGGGAGNGMVGGSGIVIVRYTKSQVV